jgi:hypothetical protein
MYMVISMPNRKSTATGVSHFMRHLLLLDTVILAGRSGLKDRQYHEIRLMIFLSEGPAS